MLRAGSRVWATRRARMAAPAIPALAAMIGVLVGSPASTGAASGGGLRAQSFDTDPTCSPATPANAPCWEGRHNRLLSGSCPTTDERFGYSATTHASSVPGEIGGRLWASYTRAYYGRVLPRARTLAHPLSASGTLWIQAGGRGGRGARTAARAWARALRRSASSTATPRVAHQQLAGTARGGGRRPGPLRGGYRVRHQELQGRRALAAGAGRAPPPGRGPSVSLEAGLQPLGRRPPRRHQLSIPGVGASTQPLDPGDRSFGAVFNRFGLINHMIEGNDATLYFGDLAINGVRQNLARGPAGWEGRGNDATFADCMIDNRHDFGYTGAGNGGGPGVVGPAPSHAVGGVFWQTEAGLGSAYSAYYADRIPTLTLNHEIYARGTVVLVRASSDSAINFGVFNAATVDVGQHVPHSFVGLNTDGPSRAGHYVGQHVPHTFVGLNTDGPSRAGHYFRPVLRSRSGPLLRPGSGPTIIANGARHTWTFHYVPDRRGRGRLTATFAGRTQVESIPPW